MHVKKTSSGLYYDYSGILLHNYDRLVLQMFHTALPSVFHNVFYVEFQFKNWQNKNCDI